MDITDILIFPTAGFLLLVVAGGVFNFPNSLVPIFALLGGVFVLAYLISR